MRVAKINVLISFAVTAKLICTFGFAYADYWFSHEAAHMAVIRSLRDRSISNSSQTSDDPKDAFL